MHIILILQELKRIALNIESVGSDEKGIHDIRKLS